MEHEKRVGFAQKETGWAEKAIQIINWHLNRPQSAQPKLYVRWMSGMLQPFWPKRVDASRLQRG